MRDDNCIFCKIANGDIPSDTIYEDEEFRVILDLSPASKGHALILPKTHAANLFELDDEICAKVLILAKKIGKAMQTALCCDGINIVQNNGEAAGQTVMHFHVHIIPRYNGEKQIVAWEPKQSIPEEQREIVEKIKTALI
ncbi:MAG: HIT family protein [Eubacteriales bacterium]|nr:HIT family protein [Eubacteriales bacterium]